GYSLVLKYGRPPLSIQPEATLKSNRLIRMGVLVGLYNSSNGHGWPIGTEPSTISSCDMRLGQPQRKPSSNLEQQLLHNGLFEVIEADRFDGDVAFATDDVIAIVFVEAFGRLRREDVFRRLHDNWQAVDNHALRDHGVTNLAKANNALIIIAVSGN